jgi:hypothetical protein
LGDNLFLAKEKLSPGSGINSVFNSRSSIFLRLKRFKSREFFSNVLRERKMEHFFKTGINVYPAKNHYSNAETVSISHHGPNNIRPRGQQKFLRSFLQKATPRRAAGGPELSYFNPVKPVGGEMRVPPRVMKEESEFITRTGGEREKVHPPGIDLSRLTDQVYRMLERKITNERQRRGW